MSTEIRPFHLDDSGEASAVIVRCLREVNSRDYTPHQVERLCGEFTPEKVQERFGRSSFVAVRDKEVIGTATLQTDKLGSVFVRSFGDYVTRPARSWRRQAVGAAC